jgi:hypothetical protein
MPFTLPTAVTFANIGFVDSSSSGANLWDLGIFDAAGNLKAHTGPFSLTAAGVTSLPIVGGQITLPAGTYYFALTANEAASRLGVFNATTIPSPVSNHLSATASAGGTLPATAAIPAAGVSPGNIGGISFSLF